MPLKVLDRYLIREMLLTQMAVILVLLLIILGGMLARLLGEVAEGRIPADVLPVILALGSFRALILLLPVSLFLAVMLTLGRLYKDSEMAALKACGVGYGRLFVTVMAITLPLSALLAVLSLYVGPWTTLQVDEIRAETAQRSDLMGITPGRFLQAGSVGGTVFFVESFSDDREVMHNVFIQRRQGEDTEVVVARSAEQQVDPGSGQRFLVLRDGHRYEGSPGDADFRIIQFATHGVRMPDPRAVTVRSRTDNVPTADLWGSDRLEHRAELQWRLAAPLSMLLLAVLALPLSYTSPRQGRFAKLAAGVGIYVVYAQMQMVSKDWFADGDTPAWLGMWWVHLGLVVLALVLLWRQYGSFWILRGWRRAKLA
ncbi:permease [Ectothiorhodospira haloalkaliphila]|uniref:Lipopolysaccharide export system permease protein LptF n=1 Tax=Ectothiorhodospira haloalkaliphila TaxID=421628 RepID=W8KT66_9GAMM|nr:MULTISPECIES: LPS export ABC transporter permease LptF [Ectothiorhodospira]AHK78761.1 permease [Ectothiorhodospira haloalkaliphila]MCG5495277.1 LPS export ABC transporter permease LptF [Ectothiorhodospira variabilis]MCG5497482.1 LPS export ABC transporter permease LptF [Ectothiorhodospira variabilis]MCG5504875.1 LPS export ABC transporter permease LptF [Ectothiorhodospira variabilis]MCG5508032.1 LPS export ABC transporter permease LptF [Ectothiorhodospira variabilis]